MLTQQDAEKSLEHYKRMKDFGCTSLVVEVDWLVEVCETIRELREDLAASDCWNPDVQTVVEAVPFGQMLKEYGGMSYKEVNCGDCPPCKARAKLKEESDAD